MTATRELPPGSRGVMTGIYRSPFHAHACDYAQADPDCAHRSLTRTDGCGYAQMKIISTLRDVDTRRVKMYLQIIWNNHTPRTACRIALQAAHRGASQPAVNQPGLAGRSAGTQQGAVSLIKASVAAPRGGLDQQPSATAAPWEKSHVRPCVCVHAQRCLSLS